MHIIFSHLRGIFLYKLFCYGFGSYYNYNSGKCYGYAYGYGVGNNYGYGEISGFGNGDGWGDGFVYAHEEEISEITLEEE